MKVEEELETFCEGVSIKYHPDWNQFAASERVLLFDKLGRRIVFHGINSAFNLRSPFVSGGMRWKLQEGRIVRVSV